MEMKCRRYGTFVTDSEIDFNNEFSGNYVICANDELVEMTDRLRFYQYGFTDLVSKTVAEDIRSGKYLSVRANSDLVDADNDVYYTFYVMFDAKNKEIKLEAQCNNGEQDDFVFYDLPLAPQDKEDITMWLIGQLTKDLFNN